MYIYYNISMMHNKFEKHYSYKHYHREITLISIRTFRPYLHRNKYILDIILCRFTNSLVFLYYKFNYKTSSKSEVFIVGGDIT